MGMTKYGGYIFGQSTAMPWIWLSMYLAALRLTTSGIGMIFLFEYLALRWIRISVYPSQCQAFLFIVYTGNFSCDGHEMSTEKCRKSQKAGVTYFAYKGFIDNSSFSSTI